MAVFVGMSKKFGVCGYAFLLIWKSWVKRAPDYPISHFYCNRQDLLLTTGECNNNRRTKRKFKLIIIRSKNIQYRTMVKLEPILNWRRKDIRSLLRQISEWKIKNGIKFCFTGINIISNFVTAWHISVEK